MNPIFFAIGCLLLAMPQSIDLNPLLTSKRYTMEESYRVVLSGSSKLSILGRTNINQFQCKYTQSIEPEVMEIQVQAEKDGLSFSNAFIRLQTIHFKCGPSQMNQDLQTFLKVKQHPTATIRLLKAKLSKEQMKESRVDEVLSEMEITLAGVTRQYSIPVCISQNGEEYLLNGSVELNICDFNLDPPVVMMGLVRVKEEVSVRFELKACIEKTIIH